MPSTQKSILAGKLLVAMLALPMLVSFTSPGQAKIKKCKIKVVGGSFKGQSFPLKMKDGKFIGQSGMSPSNLPGCRVKKLVYGRWYHLCNKGTLIVYKRKDNKWKRLKDKSLLKYQHTCF